MKLCNWPEGCERPVRANHKCASHNVMWQRNHATTRRTPKRRGPTATRMPKAEAVVMAQRPSALQLVGFLSGPPCSLDALVAGSGMGRTTVLTALRALEAAGLKIQRTTNAANGREVLRHVEPTDLERWFYLMHDEVKR